MSNDTPKVCSCNNPSMFHFKEIREGGQVWIHVTCGGEYYVRLIKSK